MKAKKLFSSMVVATFCMAMFSFMSCCKDDEKPKNNHFPNALVTAKYAKDNTFYLQLDDATTLLPTNLKKSPFGKKEVRALANIKEVKQDSKGYTKAVFVNWIDSILTKSTVPTLGEKKNDEKYGKDPVEIINDWVTVAEDRYLTLRFRTRWGNSNKRHHVNLLTGTNKDNPYELEFRHNAHGDTKGRIGDALVAFNLKDLPDTKGEKVKLKLTWMSFRGKKSVEFDFMNKKDMKKTLEINRKNITHTIE